LLDIGCAFGFFLEVARDNGWDCHGVEVCEYSSTYAKEKLGLNVRAGKLKDIRYPENFFDVIVLLDIIEHLKRPTDILGEVHRILKPDGLIVIITPNADSLIAKIMKAKWVLYQRPLEHLYYFTPLTLTSMLNKIGFRVIRCKKWGEGGKFVNLGFIFKRMKYYSFFFNAIYALVKLFRLEKKSIYADIGDNMVLYAKKARP
jgi:2-polyprenyl-3-methyl-5-hydroxy-6-metoxy-1,4-benzoquinol methylase